MALLTVSLCGIRGTRTSERGMVPAESTGEHAAENAQKTAQRERMNANLRQTERRAVPAFPGQIRRIRENARQRL